MTADPSAEFSLVLCCLWNWEQGIEADAELCMQGDLLVQAALCAVQVSQTVGIFGWMAHCRFLLYTWKQRQFLFYLKVFGKSESRRVSLNLSTVKAGITTIENAFMLMWSMSLYSVISKARLLHSCLAALVFLKSALLPRSCMVIW